MSDGKKAQDAGEASTSTAATGAQQPAQQQQDSLPGYGPLDEDDEFDDFPVQDWPDSDTVQHATKAAAAAAAAAGSSTSNGASGSDGAGLKMAGGQSSTGDHLWEDNWDDDDVEDEFSKALRAEVEKQMGTQTQAMAT
ncbi:unnamed protein product [Tilletia laevis]|uniref:26S proteasome complex subunit SEM1 n=2 Tax=Tilletia TaxID=13289 RepID=A0A177VB60_9BASI|nr:hypothetical protein CF336_g7891 [Tilletia laevis]KAE8247333.1 hypothetical protein A4X03_0g7074 [Tilletia caries]KAE8186585.1 hypothetical protein CF335_g7402 [Tilletia laevis]CAD6888605.1 unnamed protein product [Tilletia caries]CAD6908206.1 unnamed protein product [Tilletia caries]